MEPTAATWRRSVPAVVLGALLAVTGVVGEPVRILAATAARRLDAGTNDRSAIHVISTGRETLEWDVPALVPGPYRIELTVRTGNNDADPLNCVRSYRA
jgi:hypothetical protein